MYSNMTDRKGNFFVPACRSLRALQLWCSTFCPFVIFVKMKVSGFKICPVLGSFTLFVLLVIHIQSTGLNKSLNHNVCTCSPISLSIAVSAAFFSVSLAFCSDKPRYAKSLVDIAEHRYRCAKLRPLLFSESGNESDINALPTSIRLISSYE